MQKKSITSFFEQIEDHRRHNKLHKLIDVIIIAICGVVAGADTYEQIEILFIVGHNSIWITNEGKTVTQFQ